MPALIKLRLVYDWFIVYPNLEVFNLFYFERETFTVSLLLRLKLLTSGTRDMHFLIVSLKILTLSKNCHYYRNTDISTILFNEEKKKTDIEIYVHMFLLLNATSYYLQTVLVVAWNDVKIRESH